MEDLFASYRADGEAHDEMFDGTPVRPSYEDIRHKFAAMTAEEMRARADFLSTSYLDQGITFAVGGVERPFPLDIMPQADRRGRLEAHRDRRRAAGPGARGLPRRRLRRRRGVHRRGDAALGGHHQPALPARGGEPQAAQRRPGARRRHRPDPRRRRRLPGAGGQRPGAVRGVLRDDEPAGDVQRAARGVRRPPDPTGRTAIRAGCWRRCARPRRPEWTTRRWSC